jgi:thiosulfate reductase cytochrome b subunit
LQADTTRPRWLRTTHWLNVVAVLILMLSGWRIYDAAPFLPFVIPKHLTLGGWLGGALQWHFAAMWLLAANGLAYLAINVASLRLFRTFLPVSPRALLADFLDAVRLRLAHDRPGYNAIQRFAYLFAMLDLTVMVMSGLVLWKSVQFPHLRELLGGYETARRVHFLAMVALAGFTVVHVTMVALVPRTLLPMIIGQRAPRAGVMAHE